MRHDSSTAWPDVRLNFVIKRISERVQGKYRVFRTANKFFQNENQNKGLVATLWLMHLSSHKKLYLWESLIKRKNIPDHLLYYRAWGTLHYLKWCVLNVFWTLTSHWHQSDRHLGYTFHKDCFTQYVVPSMDWMAFFSLGPVQAWPVSSRNYYNNTSKILWKFYFQTWIHHFLVVIRFKCQKIIWFKRVKVHLQYVWIRHSIQIPSILSWYSKCIFA